jgi:ABC-2 type transport system permease protein
MAGMTLPGGKQEQLRLIGWLRWRLFVNSLRTRRGKADLASKILLGILVGSLAFGTGALLGVGSWSAIRSGSPLVLAGLLWFVLVVWVVAPILISGFGAESDPASLLRFPLRYSTFVLLSFMHGIFDPVAVAALYWLVAMLAGIALASPGALVWAIPALAAFALFNLLLNRAIFAWFSRWMAQRRTREIMGALLILLMLSFQLAGPLAERYGKHALPMATRLASAGRFLPPGTAAYAITAGRTGRAGNALAEFAGLLVYCAVLGWLLSVRLRAEYRGENLSEARQESAVASTTVRAGWNLAGLSPKVAALFEKDLRYLVRNSRVYLTLLTPLFIVIVLSLGHGGPHGRHPGLVLSRSGFFPLSVGYVMLTVVGLIYNSLGYDGPGLPMLLAAPIPFRDVLVAKNLLHTLVFVAEVLAISVLGWFAVGPTPPLLLGLTLAGALFVLLANLAAGNLVSLYFPRKLNFGQMRRQQASGMAIAATLGIQLLLGAVISGMYFLARWTGHLSWCGAALLALAGAAWVAYRRVLGMAGSIAWKRREALMAELSRSG